MGTDQRYDAVAVLMRSATENGTTVVQLANSGKLGTRNGGPTSKAPSERVVPT